MGLITAGIGALGGLIGSKSKAKGQRAAAQAAAAAGQQGFNYLKDSPIGTTYLPNGARANQQQADLLGVGGDPAAAQQGFQNYLGSTGYKFQLDQGSEAITNNAASRGLLNSGATLKGLNDYGQNMGAQYFNNYLGQLGGVSQAGQRAGESIGGAATQAGGIAADAYGTGYSNASSTMANGWTNALGTVLGGIRGRK